MTNDKITNDLVERIKKRPDLVISRLPKNTKDRFLEMCNDDDFCDDRGMLLKYLIDFHDGILVGSNEKLIENVELLNKKVFHIEERLNKKQEPKPITRLDGSMKR